MSQAKIIFSLEGTEIIIECSNEEKMRDIRERYATKIETNLESPFVFIRRKSCKFRINFWRTIYFAELNKQWNKGASIQKKMMDSYEQKYGEKIELNTKIIDYLISSNKDIIVDIIGTNLIVENILKDDSMNYLQARIKNIKVLLNSINEDIKKNNEILKSLIKD